MEEDVETRYVWFCLLALADRDGFVDMTTSSIARRINIEEDKVIKAIDKFTQPDLSSRTKGDEGRRLEKIRESFGWRIINYTHYRDLKTDEMRREYMKDYMRKQRSVDDVETKNTKSQTIIPADSLAFMWNKICKNLPQVREMSILRKSKERQRLSEKPRTYWSEVFEKINNSKFCKGQGNTGWKATYDWIISNTDNALKVMEGKYDGYAGGSQQPLDCERGTAEDKYTNLPTETIDKDNT